MTRVLDAQELLARIWRLQEQLKDAGIESSIRGYRFGRISILAYNAGEWWEIDFDEFGSLTFERYKSVGISENPEEEIMNLIRSTKQINQDDVQRLKSLTE